MRTRAAAGRVGEPPVLVGTAGWVIPALAASRFTEPGSHLARYASRLRCAEINSAFYRSHRTATYERWAATTPPGFRFAVKTPRAITHDLALRRAASPFATFLAETAALGDKRGPLLVQLPPSAVFERRVATSFLAMVRDRYDGPLVCEPRHPSWFAAPADALLARHRVARVAADPAVTEGADRPGGWSGLAYFRMHGSPRIYWSPYDAGRLTALADSLRRQAVLGPVWCVFDNTASGAALLDAMALCEQLGC